MHLLQRNSKEKDLISVGWKISENVAIRGQGHRYEFQGGGGGCDTVRKTLKVFYDNNIMTHCVQKH